MPVWWCHLLWLSDPHDCAIHINQFQLSVFLNVCIYDGQLVQMTFGRVNLYRPLKQNVFKFFHFTKCFSIFIPYMEPYMGIYVKPYIIIYEVAFIVHRVVLYIVPYIILYMVSYMVEFFFYFLEYCIIYILLIYIFLYIQSYIWFYIWFNMQNIKKRSICDIEK